jgi:2,5-diketo-D-gluconate reductase A
MTPLILNDGQMIPRLGFGTYPLRGEKGVTAIRTAIDAGYRLIDTAFNYDNEAAVGRAIAESGVPREDFFVTSKLPGRYHTYDAAVDAIHESVWRLGLDYIDLHLIHWPNPSEGRFAEAWQALIDARAEGAVRSVGVANFTLGHLAVVEEATGIRPAVNQIELHPYFPQEEQLAAHKELGIVTEAWSPLGERSAVREDPVIGEIARAHGVSPAQAVLRWHLQRGVLPIPKSADPVRQADNLDVFGFELTEGEVEVITALGRPDGRILGEDPDFHQEM